MIEALCREYTLLSYDDINKIMDISKSLQLMADFYESDVFIDVLDKNETFARNNADSFIILRHYESKEMLKQKQIEIDQILIDYVKKAKNGYQIRLCCGICCYEDVIENLLSMSTLIVLFLLKIL